MLVLMVESSPMGRAGIVVQLLLCLSACKSSGPGESDLMSTPAPSTELVSESVPKADVPESTETSVRCSAGDFDVCTQVCFSRRCLDWCAGTACGTLGGEMNACARGLWKATEQSDDRPAALAEAFDRECAASCSAQLDHHEPRARCTELALRSLFWPFLSVGIPVPDDIEVPGPEYEAQAAASVQTRVPVEQIGPVDVTLDKLDVPDDGMAVSMLVASGWKAEDFDVCGIPREITPPKTFLLDVTMNDRGRVESVLPATDDAEAKCVANVIREGLELPPSAATGLTLQVVVTLGNPLLDGTPVPDDIMSGTELAVPYGIDEE